MASPTRARPVCRRQCCRCGAASPARIRTCDHLWPNLRRRLFVPTAPRSGRTSSCPSAVDAMDVARVDPM